MPKHYAVAVALLTALLTLGTAPVAGGQPAGPLPPRQGGPRTCATEQSNDATQAGLKRTDPAYHLARLTRRAPQAPLGTAVSYTLPYVVHVIHDGEAVGSGSNISFAQAQSQLDVLNEDYRNINADGALVPAPFQPARADAHLHFVPATQDPNGNFMPEAGIDRVNRAAKGFAPPPYASTAYINATIKPGTYWDPTKYLNIWVMNLGGNLLGYAQFPDNTAGLDGLNPLGGAAATDGVVVLYLAYGRVGNLAPPYNKGRTLTHELGHWLGLRHTWGDASCGDDFCADVPTQQGPNFGCPAFPRRTCGNTASGDQFMNYLDYTDDACMFMFSADQVSRMQAVLAAGTPLRSELATSTPFCPNGGVAASATNSGPACPGGTITLSANGPAGATYAWTGPGGFVSTLPAPVLRNVAPAQAGTYTATVTVPGGNQCPRAVSTTVVVNPAPLLPVLTTASALVCFGAPTVLAVSNYGTPPAVSYAWTLVSGDGLPAATNTPSLTVAPTQTSVYRLMVTLLATGCSASAELTVRVVPPVWTGAANDGDWHNPANWESGCVPSRLTDALIPGGLATRYPLLSTGLAEVRDLTQQGPVSQTGGELAIYGNLVGTMPLRLTGGTVSTRGTGPQTLTANAFQTLTVAGTGVKTLTDAGGSAPTPASVEVSLALAGGVLNPTSPLTLGARAALSGETNTSYVLGQLRTTREVAAVAPQSFGGLGLTLTTSVGAGPTTVTRTTGQGQTAGANTSIARYYDVRAAQSRSLRGATLSLSYLPRELSGLAENQLALFRSTTAGASWTNEGVTQHDPANAGLSRDFVTDLNGRWTAASLNAPLSIGPAAFAINALPVPFNSDGLSLQISTATAGPVSVKLYDVLGRVVYDQAVANVEVGTSTISLPGTRYLPPARYILLVSQGDKQVRLQVVRE